MVKKYLIKWGNKTENIYTIWKAVLVIKVLRREGSSL